MPVELIQLLSLFFIHHSLTRSCVNTHGEHRIHIYIGIHLHRKKNMLFFFICIFYLWFLDRSESIFKVYQEGETTSLSQNAKH